MKVYVVLPLFLMFVATISTVFPEKLALHNQDKERILFVDGVILGADGPVYIDIAYIGQPEDEDKVLQELGAVEASPFSLTGFRFTVTDVTYTYNPNGAQVTQEVVEDGLSTWNALSDYKARIAQVNSGAVASLCAGDGGDGQRVFDWAEIPGIAIGVACWGPQDECDGRLDSTYPSDSEFLWRLVTGHEMGHCFGLGHSIFPDALMYSSVGFQQGLTADDIAGFCAIYQCIFGQTPTPTSTRTPTPTNIPPSLTPTPTATATRTLPTGPCEKRPVYPFCVIAIGVSRQ